MVARGGGRGWWQEVVARNDDRRWWQGMVDLEEKVDCRVPQVRDADAFQDCLPVRAGLRMRLGSGVMARWQG